MDGADTAGQLRPARPHPLPRRRVGAGRDGYSTDDLGLTETLFAVGNGYLGMRGNVEEGRDVHAHGTFINGFHETWPIRHAEEAFGFAQTGQTIVNVPDVKIDQALRRRRAAHALARRPAGRTSARSTSATACCAASLVWRTPAGKRVLIESTPHGVVRRSGTWP